MTALDQGPDGSPAGSRPRPPSAVAASSAPGERSPSSPGERSPSTAGELSAAARGRHAGAGAEGFGSVVTWTVFGALVPGVGLLAAGRRRAGSAVLGVAALLVTGAAVTALAVDPMALVRGLLTDPDGFVTVASALGAVTVLWALTVVLTHLTLRRQARLTGRERALGVVLLVALVGVVAVPAAVAGNDALVARRALTSVFGSPATRLGGASTPQAEAADPWAAVPRVNVLLMGGDSGADRTGVRPDTMIVASVDTRTGDTLLVSLPRNLQRVPFPAGSRAAAEYPNGFHCINPTTGTNTECLLNALWGWGDAHPQDYPGDPHPGLTATIQGAEQVTGLHIDDYVMLNLRGFQQFVDIIGGLRVNITERLPVGGSVEHPVATSWLEPGRQTLNGYLTLWYARSRWSTTDYDRMRRQRCVIGDLVDQIDPVTVALRFSRVATTMQQNLQTSIPLQDLGAWVTLAQRVKQAHVRSLAFTDQVINTTRPDIAAMHDLVQQALTPPAPTSGASSSTTPSTGTSTTPSTGTSTTPSTGTPSAAPTQAQDVNQVC